MSLVMRSAVIPSLLAGGVLPPHPLALATRLTALHLASITCSAVTEIGAPMDCSRSDRVSVSHDRPHRTGMPTKWDSFAPSSFTSLKRDQAGVIGRMKSVAEYPCVDPHDHLSARFPATLAERQAE